MLTRFWKREGAIFHLGSLIQDFPNGVCVKLRQKTIRGLPAEISPKIDKLCSRKQPHPHKIDSVTFILLTIIVPVFDLGMSTAKVKSGES